MKVKFKTKTKLLLVAVVAVCVGILVVIPLYANLDNKGANTRFVNEWACGKEPHNHGAVIVLPNPNDCSKFYECSNGVPIPMDCPKHLYFCVEKLVCDWRWSDCVFNCFFP
ncbi:MAG: carbohydrate-binding module family 14 protein [Dysgonamonadaceae bacterium]|jgi:hypothetical protein|nr:carbohydrate-binding module family 14 protein [Dysgonamonadaceae bacterium]